MMRSEGRGKERVDRRVVFEEVEEEESVKSVGWERAVARMTGRMLMIFMMRAYLDELWLFLICIPGIF